MNALNAAGAASLTILVVTGHVATSFAAEPPAASPPTGNATQAPAAPETPSVEPAEHPVKMTAESPTGETQLRSPGSPAKTTLDAPTGPADLWQYFYLYNPNFFAVGANGGWPPIVKFQVSIRFDMLRLGGEQNAFGLSFAYTQKSFWDLFNAVGTSSPFIESNYQPELFVTYRPERQQSYREFQLGVQHESNGVGNLDGNNQEANSRSWSYLFGEARWGFRREDPKRSWFFFTPGLRGWIPFESSSRQLVDTLGYFTALLDIDVRAPGAPAVGTFYARLKVQRHAAQADVFYPLTAITKLHFRASIFVQLFAGQGERLQQTATETQPAPSVVHLYTGLGFD